ncbi:MAG: thiE [Gemmatimonadetes bacterium]|nr:thiE [Gemmatimonadota bacterium]
MARSPLPRLHVVTDDAIVARPGFVEAARQVLEAGGDRIALHVRAPAGSGRQVYGRAAELVPIARSVGAMLVVNDRVDVALAVAADGAHLGRRSLSVGDARRMLGSDRLIGASVGARAEADDAIAGGADYLLAGSIYPTASHPGRPGIGVGLIAEMSRLGVPVIAIGGITVDRVAEVLAAGAAGVAVIRSVWDAGDPAVAVGRLIVALGSSELERPSSPAFRDSSTRS